MFFDLHHSPARDIRREASTLLKLALPMMVAQLAQVATGFVDTVMAGNVSTDDLAAVAMGASVFVTFYVTLMGVATALNPILSQLFGAGRQQEIGETARQGLIFCTLLGLVGAGLMLAITPLLRLWLDLPADVEDKIALYIAGAAFGMPAAIAHRALHAFASSLGHPRPIMVVSLIALALNVPLNYILIHGLYGLPAMGGAGCGWATGIVFWFNAITLYLYLRRSRHFRQYGLTARRSRPDWRRYLGFLRLGLPIGLSFFVEVSLFSFISLLIAQLGTQVVASHQAVLNFSSLIYMVPQALGTALSVRVGQAIGAGDYRQARFASGVGLATGLGCAFVMMLLVLALRPAIIAMYTRDPAVLAMGATLLLFAAAYQLTDAVQTIASGALRGYKLTTMPMVIHVTSFWGLGLGLGVVLGLSHWLGQPMGVYGFWSALVVSLSVAALILIAYLARESRRRLARQHTKV